MICRTGYETLPFNYFIPATKGFQVAQTAKFFQSFSSMPTLTNEEYAIFTARELIDV